MKNTQHLRHTCSKVQEKHKEERKKEEIENK